MPPSSLLQRSKATLTAAAITTHPPPTPLLPLLAPRLSERTTTVLRYEHRRYPLYQARSDRDSSISTLEASFFTALSYASRCPRHRTSFSPSIEPKASPLKPLRRSFAGLAARRRSQSANLTNVAYAERPTTLPTNIFNSKLQVFADSSNLPQDFYNDVTRLQRAVELSVSRAEEKDQDASLDASDTLEQPPDPGQDPVSLPDLDAYDESEPDPQSPLDNRLKLLRSVRDLEEKLAKERAKLHRSMGKVNARDVTPDKQNQTVALTKDDYLGLVDLYFYTHEKRFGPDAPDSSPTPTFIEDYSFKLSENFAGPQAFANYYVDEEGYESPLKGVEDALRRNQLHEIDTMLDLINLLIDDQSSNKKLYEAYKRLPSPGVAFLPKGVIRLFLQRMSTPWVKSEAAVFRYMSVIDDMQKAKLPITVAEWSSAIYLTGQGLGPLIKENISSAFTIWRQMELEAGVKSSHVTFNILFDIAVRAGKYALATTLLKEMHQRGLRLNRLGRVSLTFYHGIRGDGDAVRKSYRDFVDAGEIVDTLVLNCVIASLMNAQEPSAAEQIYERMKDIQKQFNKGTRPDGNQLLYRRYPPLGDVHINREMASNSLGRILLYSSRLKHILPDQHSELQAQMPLTPDHITFRALISHHANVSGDLNRITILIREMTQLFDLPMQDVFFQLLFKGFALHTTMRDPDCTWNYKRLEQTWEVYRKAVQQSRGMGVRRDGETYSQSKARDKSKAASAFPTAEEVEKEPAVTTTIDLPPEKRLTDWQDFVIDLGIYPRERRKPIERVHSELFDEQGNLATIDTTSFSNSFFPRSQRPPRERQETYYPLGQFDIDHEEGEYTLPDPSAAITPGGVGVNGNDVPSRTHEQNPQLEYTINATGTDQIRDNDNRQAQRPVHQMRMTRPLVCWLLRAFARSTGSRAKVEEVWNSVRKLYQPPTQADEMAVKRVLKRCLKDCDLYNGHML